MSAMGVFDGTETELVIRHTLLNHPLDVRTAQRAQLASELRPREAGVVGKMLRFYTLSPNLSVDVPGISVSL